MEEDELVYYPDMLRLNEGLEPEDIKCDFRRAVAEGFVHTVMDTLQLRDDIDINAVDFMGCTYVHTAIFFGRLPMLRYLLTLDGVRVDIKNKLGDTPLMQALRINLGYEAIKLLVDKGSNVNSVTHRDMTPLHFACERNGNYVIAELLVNKGADVNALEISGEGPLSAAIRCGDYDTVCMLLYYNASVNTVPQYGFTPFLIALYNKKEKIAELLIDYVDNFEMRNFIKETALYIAVCHHLNIIACEIVERCQVDLPVYNNVVLEILYAHPSERHLLQTLWTKINAPCHLSLSKTEWLPVFIQNTLFSKDETLSILESIFGSEGFQYNPRIHSRPVYKQIYELAIDSGEETRVTWTYIFLSFSIPIYSSEVEYLYKMYGFCGEIAAILSSETYIEPDFLATDFLVLKILRNTCFSTKAYEESANIYKYYMYGSLSESEGKVPSLLQLSRDVYRSYVYARYQTSTNLGAYNALVSLDLPDIIKDILILKQPIY